ncbi:hypothetical protein T08_16400 [Trichinella sp. T8]|nr:hypothetical protein T08_16400 [Trichinella sp. T8]
MFKTVIRKLIWITMKHNLWRVKAAKQNTGKTTRENLHANSGYEVQRLLNIAFSKPNLRIR